MKGNEGYELRITGGGDIYINQGKVCIHPVEDQSLPRGDIIAGLLMTLATDLRRGVLSGPDLEAIEFLLPLEESIIALKGLTKQMKGSESHERSYKDQVDDPFPAGTQRGGEGNRRA